MQVLFVYASAVSSVKSGKIMANQFNNYVWQGGYFPPTVQPAPQFHSTCSSLQPQPVNPGPSHNPSSLQQYVPPHSPCTSVSQPTPTDFYLKIFNPANKKEFQLYTMPNLSLDIDNPDKLRQALSEQYGDLLPPIDKMEVGYFHQAKKMWIKNRLDLNDVWKLVQKGERVTLWSMGATTETNAPTDVQKRPLDKSGSSGEQPVSKRSKTQSTSDEKRALVANYEQRLQQKHEDKYSRFQIKIWAEALASDQYSDLDTPPGYAMFSREKDKKTAKDGNVDVVMSGMVNMMNTLCQALTPKVIPLEKRQSIGLSPMKKAELRSTYLKQLGELRQLRDNGILTEEEYEEQREDLIDSMRNLKEQGQ